MVLTKMRVSMLTFITFFMWMQGDVDSVRIVELRVSAHMAEGGDALLGCYYDMGHDSLYSLKWYKDDREFYRYVPKAHPTMRTFFVPGVKVDLNLSSANVVALKHLVRNSSGVYKCEVKGEMPSLTMDSRKQHVTIDLLPKSGPQVYGLRKDYHIGSHVDVNCTTSPSRPEAQLKWLINGKPAPNAYLHGPYLVIPTNRPYTYQAKLRLNYTVLPSHFDDEGVMTLKCQATIPPLYLQETSFKFHEPSLRTTLPMPATTTETNTGDIASTGCLLSMKGVLIILLIFQVLLV
ncbi:hypothetical protein ABMA28_002077 [Loxostege sticticalis]|uniref:Ig-like domain-containing protein n=1 Tax=Loxostege sticticalis TaxID=481309 RepID=A0ABD0SZP1_LOXSC